MRALIPLFFVLTLSIVAFSANEKDDKVRKISAFKKKSHMTPRHIKKLKNLKTAIADEVHIATRGKKKKIIQSRRINTTPGLRQVFPLVNQPIFQFLHEGDIFLSEKQIDEKTAANDRVKRKVYNQTGSKWPVSGVGVIPYTFDASAGFTQSQTNVILSAVQFWEANLCVEFVYDPTATASNGLRFTKAGGCWSQVGFVGGWQLVSIDTGCEYFGIVTHEIGHALDFWHEQSRIDRDPYLEFFLQNVQTGEESNFALEPQMNLYGIPFDYGSVMHYFGTAFSANGDPTMVALKDPLFRQTMGSGQTKGPTFLDVLQLNIHYNCIAACSANDNALCQNMGYANPKNCAVCVCPEGFGGDFCDQVQPAENGNCGGILTASSTWQTLTATVGSDYTWPPTTTVSACYWWIQSPANTQIELNATSVIGACGDGCTDGYLELRAGSDIRVAGPRFCCAADVTNASFISTRNFVTVAGVGTYPMSFNVQYRVVSLPNPSTTTAATTTPITTSTPTTTTSRRTTPTTTTSRRTTPTTTTTSRRTTPTRTPKATKTTTPATTMSTTTGQTTTLTSANLLPCSNYEKTNEIVKVWIYPWSECSVTCGDGLQTMEAKCGVNGYPGFPSCICDSGFTRACNLGPCETTMPTTTTTATPITTTKPSIPLSTSTRKPAALLPCSYFETYYEITKVGFYPWSACSATCGSGTQTLGAICYVDGYPGNPPCICDFGFTEPCNLGECPTIFSD